MTSAVGDYAGVRFSINIPNFGDFADPVVLATCLDEGLDLLNRFWSGEPVTRDGPHYRVHDVSLQPATVQRPRPPVWVAGY